jgi:hypothetical protein
MRPISVFWQYVCSSRACCPFFGINRPFFSRKPFSALDALTTASNVVITVKIGLDHPRFRIFAMWALHLFA